MKKLFRERGYYKSGRVLPFAEFRPFRDLEKGITFCDGRMASVMEAAEEYARVLKPGGYLAFEFGDTQADAVCRILAENGYTILERARDYNGIERAVLAQYGRKEEI